MGRGRREQSSVWSTLRFAMLPILLFAGSAARAEPVQVTELAPVSPWQVVWAKSSCGLRRLFGDDKHPLYVQFEWFQPGQAFQLLLTSRHLRGLKSPRRFSIHYGDDGAVHQIDRYHTGAAKDGTPTVFVMRSSLNANNEESASRASAEMEAAITRISVAWREKRLVLATGSLEKPLAEVRKCTDQLLEAWGLDPAQQRSRSRPPIPSDPGRWLVGWDYPERALRKGAQSLINFRLTVGPDGQPTACEVQGSYSGELFAKRTCQLLMIRARFQPALDAKGQAIPSYYVNQVSWLTGLP